MTWISFVLWVALMAPPAAAGPIEVGVVIFDPEADRVAALRLSEGPRVADEDFGGEGRVLWVRLESPPPDRVRGGPSVGFATGDDVAVRWIDRASKLWSNPRVSLAAVVAERSAGVFEGSACEDCVVARRKGVAVIGIGVDQPDVDAIARHVSAVPGDVVTRLLQLADDAPQLWPHAPGPASAMLVAHGDARPEEVIAVDKHGKVGRRLADRHFHHLADVALPFHLSEARDAWNRGDEDDLEVHRRRALAAARRALEVFPNNRGLQRRLRQAESLRPEHLNPTP